MESKAIIWICLLKVPTPLYRGKEQLPYLDLGVCAQGMAHACISRFGPVGNIHPIHVGMDFFSAGSSIFKAII
jgi:hypothetical protein